MKKMSLFLISFSLALAANANTITANRTICSPQDHDMTTGPFTTTCDWSKWKRGDDADALITLTGKQNVHAECYFMGSDPIAWIRGMKQADVNVIAPPDQFSFDIGYKNDSHYDQNQNLAIYLANFPPSYDNVLTCTFTAK